MSEQAGVLTHEAMMSFLVGLRDEYPAPERPMFLFSPRTYHQIRFLDHCLRARLYPQRKLRKCHLRKIVQRRKQARLRYLREGTR